VLSTGELQTVRESNVKLVQIFPGLLCKYGVENRASRLSTPPAAAVKPQWRSASDMADLVVEGRCDGFVDGVSISHVHKRPRGVVTVFNTVDHEDTLNPPKWRKCLRRNS
jgi:hypothetical protein